MPSAPGFPEASPPLVPGVGEHTDSTTNGGAVMGAMVFERTMSRDAVLDDARSGDIVGALGTVRADQGVPRHWWARFLTFLAIMGPGLIVMVGDNDAGGVTTYAQAGQAYGNTLLWTLFLLIPVLMVAQEMVARLGAVSQVGHARLIRARFGRFWAAFSIVDLFILNALTLMTEFVGIDLGLRYFGISPYVSVPLAALALLAVAASGSFRRWERAMFLFIGVSLLMFPLALLTHPQAAPVVSGLFLPRVAGGWTSTAVLFVIAIVGTTVAPWQLFFQQSNVIDKRITTRWLRHEVTETFLGAILTNAGAAALVVAAAFAFAHTPLAGQQGSALELAQGFAAHVGRVAGDLFAVILINAALIGGATVAISSSYALADLTGMEHSLHRGVREAKGFYAVYAVMVLLSAAVVLIPHAPLGLINLGVQVLAGVLLPSAIVFLLILCNDAAVLGPWVNTVRQNIVAGVIVGVLVALSVILTVTTMFPAVPVAPLCAALAAGGVLTAGYLWYAARLGQRASAPACPAPSHGDRYSWRMPSLDQLPPMRWSRGGQTAMLVLRGYLVLAVVTMVVKIVQLAH
jgi:Mn2+/Fe2+ NRAMP family transporter